MNSGVIKSGLLQADSVHVPMQGLEVFDRVIEEGPSNVYYATSALISPGDRVEGVITRVEPNGLYLTHDGESVLVLVPDVSHQRPLHLPSTYAPGDRLMVRILRYNSEACIYKGTVVEEPESEPDESWQPTGQDGEGIPESRRSWVPTLAVPPMPRATLRGTTKDEER